MHELPRRDLIENWGREPGLRVLTLHLGQANATSLGDSVSTEEGEIIR
jgi:hypothetical protein